MAASMEAGIAVNRFGLGARRDELLRAQSDPRGWLKQQIDGGRAVSESLARLPQSAEIVQKYFAAEAAKREARRESSEMKNADATQLQQLLVNVRQVILPIYLEQVAARYAVAVNTEESFRERLIHFWTNHFAVSVDKIAVLGLAGSLENEAIRPNLHNRFVDMLIAVERHPAMILYLDNQQSSGPNSQLARMAARRSGTNNIRKIGINENLAREIMELHTLGVNGGYTQADVTTFAQALTGWSVGGGPRSRRDESGAVGKFLFREGLHEPGSKTILGKKYGEDGEGESRSVLQDLARHPSTAKFIATKLVRHFVSDDPPAEAIEKIAKVFQQHDGDLPSVHRAVIDLPGAWQGAPTKFKTPHELVTSTFRALQILPREPKQIAAPFELLGQRPYSPGSPAGWPDTANQWDGSDALMKRIEWTTALGQRAGSHFEPLAIAENALGPSLSDHSRTAIARAATAAQGVTLLLMSPEFQRR
jgi:uncharacterized protein (DUF1800 family)